MRVKLMRKDGSIVEVNYGDHVWDGSAQGVGKAIGTMAAVAKMATVDLLDKALGETQLGLGTKLGYQGAYFHRDAFLTERKMRQLAPELIDDMLGRAKIDTSGMDAEEKIKCVSRVKIKADDRTGKHRFPAFHTPIVIEKPVVKESKTVTVTNRPGRQPEIVQSY